MNWKKVILTILLAILLIFGLILLVSCSNTNVPVAPKDNTSEENKTETLQVNLDVPEEYNAVFEKYEGEKSKEDTVVLIGILKQIGLEHIKSVSGYVKGTYIEAYESENNEQSYTLRLDDILKTFEDTEKFYIKLKKSEDGFISNLTISDIEGFQIVDSSSENADVEEQN